MNFRCWRERLHGWYRLAEVLNLYRCQLPGISLRQ